MPIVEVTHAVSVAEEDLAALATLLPHEVSVAVACPEEPYDGDLRPGDVDVRFRTFGPRDAGGLDVVVEVRSKHTESRARDAERRAEQLRDAILAGTHLRSVGVYLTLPVAGWAQAPD